MNSKIVIELVLYFSPLLLLNRNVHECTIFLTGISALFSTESSCLGVILFGKFPLFFEYTSSLRDIVDDQAFFGTLQLGKQQVDHKVIWMVSRLGETEYYLLQRNIQKENIQK